MSNTDGEDTQHLKEVLSQLELIAYEVWLDHTTSGKNLYKKFKVNDMKTAIEAARKLIQNDTTLYSQEVIDSYQEELASLREQHLFERASREGFIKRLEQQLQQKEQENQELKDDYKDLKDSIQRYFQTLIARNYNNIGIWSSERQDYNYQLIEELEKLLKAHNNLSA